MSDSDDVVMFVCGGGAQRAIIESGQDLGVQTIFLNANEKSTIQLMDGNVPGSYGDEYLAYALADDKSDEISGLMMGKRIVILFSILGGGSGIGMLRVAAECAHREGCSIVSIVGIPWGFEHERRKKAVSVLPEVVSLSDRMIILDIDTINRIYPDIRFRHIMNQVANTISFAVRSIVGLMNGPFFSTFSQKIYTVAYTSDLEPSKAVSRAVESSMYDVDPAFAKSVVMISAGHGSAQVDAIFNTVVSTTGIIPDIVKRDDREDTKVLTFIPVQDL